MSAPANEHKLEQSVPVGGVPSQARDLQPHHQTCLAKSNLADKLLKTFPSSRLRARLTKIAIEDVDPFERPTQRHGAITQSILALRTLRILQNLARCGLSNVEIGIVFKMLLGNFQVRHAIDLPFEG